MKSCRVISFCREKPFRPGGPEENSPGREPGVKDPRLGRTLKGRHKIQRAQSAVPPLQGSTIVFHPTPGLRPGLFSVASSRLQTLPNRVSRQKRTSARASVRAFSRWIGSGALLWWCVQVPALAQEKDPVSAAIAGLQRRYSAVETITANFVQTYQATGMNQTESGTLWMKKPGLMYWEYKAPEAKFFYADGRRTYLYIPEDRQVMVRSFTAEDLRSTPLEFLLGTGDILRSFDALPENEIKPASGGTVMVRLVPKVANPDYSYLVLEIDGRTFDLRRLVIRERTGNLSEFAFTDMHTNLKIKNSRFHFEIPRGVEVVELDEK
jgi:outer membrane lipoprotein carrier protein